MVLRVNKLIVIIALIMSIVVSVSFASTIPIVEIDGIEVEYNENYGYPILDENNRTQVPLRITMEKFGAVVSWDDDENAAIVYKNGVTVKIPITKDYVYINDVKKYNDTKSRIINNRTYCPIRIVVEALGGEVDWNQNKNTVEIKTGKPAITVEYKSMIKSSVKQVIKGKVKETVSMSVDVNRMTDLIYNDLENDLLVNYGSNKFENTVVDSLTKRVGVTGLVKFADRSNAIADAYWKKIYEGTILEEPNKNGFSKKEKFYFDVIDYDDDQNIPIKIYYKTIYTDKSLSGNPNGSANYKLQIYKEGDCLPVKTISDKTSDKEKNIEIILKKPGLYYLTTENSGFDRFSDFECEAFIMQTDLIGSNTFDYIVFSSPPSEGGNSIDIAINKDTIKEPSFIIRPTTNINVNEAQINWEILNSGLSYDTITKVEYWEKNNPNTKFEGGEYYNEMIGNFDCKLYNLESDTDYCFQVEVRNSEGYLSKNQSSFRTALQLNEVPNVRIRDCILKNRKVIVDAKIDDLGGAIKINDYGVSIRNVTNNEEYTDISLGDTEYRLAFTYSMVDLNEGDVYAIKAYAINNAGKGESNEESVTVISQDDSNVNEITVTMKMYEDLTKDGLTLRGRIDIPDNQSITRYGFKILDKTSGKKKTRQVGEVSDSSFDFSYYFDELESGHKYLVYAYAYNADYKITSIEDFTFVAP